MKKIITSIRDFVLALIGGLAAYVLMLCMLAILSFAAMLVMIPPFYVDGAIDALLNGGNLIQIANASIDASVQFFMHVLYLPIEYLLGDFAKSVKIIAVVIGTTTAESQSYPWGFEPNWMLIGISIAYYATLALVIYRNREKFAKAKALLAPRTTRNEQASC